MRYSPESWLIVALSVFTLTGVVAMKLNRGPEIVLVGEPIGPVLVEAAPSDAAAWFLRVRQFCNPVEIEGRLRLNPPPETVDGSMHAAACHALAGKVDDARTLIARLPADQRDRAAGVVFEAGHPAADAGDDIAAGPLMELVVEFWPNHYMALYHAGAARYELGDHARAKSYLERFLVEYSSEDGWRSSAEGMLEAIEGGR